ncbi:MAG: hypothetical protein JKY56_27570 [Kofleriaceae bacterium]|nr:hypothetical protein [Kofleriaceae bacterium]
MSCGTDAAGDGNGAECYCDASCEAFDDCCINRLDVCSDNDDGSGQANAGCELSYCGTETPNTEADGTICYCDNGCEEYDDVVAIAARFAA